MLKSAVTGTLLLALCTAATATGQTCATRCDPDQGQNRLADFVHVDANSCKIVAGKNRFSTDTQIQLSIVHQNPFNYTYKYDIETREIESGIIKDALKALGLGLPPTNNAPGGGPGAQAATAQVMRNLAPVGGAANACPTLDAFFSQQAATFTQKSGDVTRQRQAALDALKTKTDALAAYNAFVKTQLPAIPKTEQQCRDLCGEGEAVLPKLGVYLDRKALKQEIASLAQTVDALQTYGNGLKAAAAPTINALGDDQADEKAACEARVKTLQDAISGTVTAFRAAHTKIETDFKTLATLDKKVKEMQTIVKSVMDSPEAFVYTDYLGARDVAVEHDVKVTRTQRETKTQQACTAGIRAGRSRFSISAGIGLSFIEQMTFGRQQAIVPTTTTQDDGTTVEGMGLGEIFAVTDTSSESLVGVFQLNGRISSGNKYSWGWALGATVGAGEGEAGSLGYFTGPTLSLISDQLFFTLAYHQREVDRLGGDFNVGEPVPTGFTSPLPVTTETEGGLLFTVTYRFR